MKESKENVPTEVELAIDEIFQSIGSGETELFFGAGLSRNSGLPIVNQLVYYIFEKLALPEGDVELFLDSERNLKIPFELFIQSIQTSSSVDELLQIYDAGEPNTNHLMIANLVKMGRINTVLTTNFDELLEKALNMQPNPWSKDKDYQIISNEQEFESVDWSTAIPRIIKIHGSVIDKESMAVTLRQVASKTLSKPRDKIIREMFAAGRHTNVLVLGYSMSDEFDITPQIAAIEEKNKNIYVLRHVDSIDDSARVESLQIQESRNPFKKNYSGLIVSYNTDQFIEALWRSFSENGAPYKLKTYQTNWKEQVDIWYGRILQDYGRSVSYSIAADLYLQMGELDAAIRYYVKALNFVKKNDDQMKVQVCVGNLGNAYMSNGEFDKAIECANEALELARVNGDRKNEGKWLGGLGNAYLHKGIHRKAVEYYVQALKQARENGNRIGECKWLGNLGIASKNIGDYDKATAYSQQALQLAKEIGDKHGEGASLSNLGSIYKNKGEFSEAKKYYTQALRIAIQLGNKKGEGTALGNLGILHVKHGEYQIAKKYCKTALKIAVEIGDKNGEGRLLGNLGVISNSSQEYDEALEYYRKAARICTDLGDKRGEESNLLNLGNTYKSLKRYDESIICYTQALDIAMEIKNGHGEGLCLGSIGNINLNKKEYDMAISYYKQALAIFEALGNRHSESLCLRNLGNAYLAKDEIDLAVQVYTKAYGIFKETIGSEHSHALELLELLTRLDVEN